MNPETFLVLLSVAVLEALLSGDNALVLAVMVKPLPKPAFWSISFLILVGGSLLALRKHA